MKVKNAIKKIGAVAASVLLVGTTLGTAATLGDFPSQYVDQEGNPQASIVVGSQSDPLDIVGAINVASALGQETIKTEEKEITETIDIEGREGWTAERGTTLDRPRRNLFLNSRTDSGLEVLVDQDLDILETTFFEDPQRRDVEVIHELSLGSNPQKFGRPRGMDEIGLHIDFSEDKVFSIDAMMDRRVDFTHENMEGEEVNFFGQTYTVSDSTNERYLVLYGDSHRYEVETDQVKTIEVAGNTHEIHVRYVSDFQATVVIDGTTRRLERGDTVRLSGQDVRVRDIFPLRDNHGIVAFGVGEQELELANRARARVDGDAVDGTRVYFNDNLEGDLVVDDLQDITIEYQDPGRDKRFIEKGDFFNEPLFGIEFHYGGPAPDASEEPAETVEVEADGNSANVYFTNERGRSANLIFMDRDTSYRLGDFHGEFMKYEGQELGIDDYIILNHDENAGMYQVTDIYYDQTYDEGEIELEDVFTGDIDKVEFEETLKSSVRINRINYNFRITEPSTNPDQAKMKVTWGPSDEYVIFPNLYTETESAVAFTDRVELVEEVGVEIGDSIKLPSTTSSSDKILRLEERNVGPNVPGSVTVSSNRLLIDISDGTYSESYEDVVTIGGLEYYMEVDLTPGGVMEEVTLSLSDQRAGTQGIGISMAMIQPEDDSGNEYGFVIDPENGNDVTFNNILGVGRAGFDLTSFRNIRNRRAAYSYFGTYMELDTGRDGYAEFNLPAYESTVGMAITDRGGSIDPSGVAEGEFTFEYLGILSEAVRGALPETGLTDAEVTQAKMQEHHLILVGGPAVNSLVADLADQGRTRSLYEWRNYYRNEALLHVVEDAFATGRNALIVAGYGAEDTRGASRYLANWKTYEDDLDTRELSLSSNQYPR